MFERCMSLLRIFFQMNIKMRIIKSATRESEKLGLISLNGYLKNINMTVVPEGPDDGGNGGGGDRRDDGGESPELTL